MKLRILLPFQVFVDVSGILRVVAQMHEGSFGLLPHRRDCVATLAPGILIYETAMGREQFVAVDEGVLVKTGADVLVSVRRAISGDDLGQLRQAVEQQFLAVDAQEDSSRAVMAKLEAGLLQRLAGLQHG
jgi:F-type H+-transporting ATPase subunit epsilon